MAQDYDSSTGHTGDASAQIARLREQVETLMRDRVTPAVAAAADRAQSDRTARTIALKSAIFPRTSAR